MKCSIKRAMVKWYHVAESVERESPRFRHRRWVEFRKKHTSVVTSVTVLIQEVLLVNVNKC